MAKATLNVSGTRFEISCSKLEEEPFQRLPLMVSEAKKNGMPLEFEIERPVERFAAIAAYYQTGELHIPTGVCPGAFQKELQYWGVDSDKMEECCMVRYISFCDEQETVKKFRHEVLRTQSVVPLGCSLNPPVNDGLTRATIRRRVWNIIDNNEPSILAKIYFVLLFLMVITSILSLALSTEPSCMREVTVCEMLEYLKYSNNPYFKVVEDVLGDPDCNDKLFKDGSFNWDMFDDIYDNYKDEKHKEHMQHRQGDKPDKDGGKDTDNNSDAEQTTVEIDNRVVGSTIKNGVATTEAVKKPPPPRPPPPPPKPISTLTPALTVASSTIADNNKPQTPSVVNSTISPYTTLAATTAMELENGTLKSKPHDVSGPNIHDLDLDDLEIPKIKVQKRVFDILDIVLLVFFTLDLALRLSCCPSIPKYFVSIINIVDIIAVAGTYVHVIGLNIEKDKKYVDSWLNIIQYFQVFRTLRLFRVVKNVRASKVLVYSVKHSILDLLLLLMFVLIAVCTFASIVYFTESRDTIESIPEGWWWAIVTLTTVGYGDVVPQTGIGRLVGAICAITGVVILSLTMPIFVNNFLALYQYAMVDETLQAKLQAKRKQGDAAAPNKVVNYSLTEEKRESLKDAKINILTVEPK